ncbi:hypothetical protein PTW37_17700 (plasmid) [Arthrobacter agilis]|uniref:hypothetical protein n=1 Tax=Arthrobacter agilis TaxID=37921 RepID=UPI00236653DE|nr:hypothetical protein [Arthrobacter agilis]WDF35235.1 hypothetical protein PTW37_17700 [Arthrobacter agilis]
MRTSIIGRPRHLSRDRRAHPAYTLNCDEPNNVDEQNAAAAAKELWDSADRRAKLAEFLTERVGTTDIEREGIAAVLAADLSNGTPPAAALKAGKRSVRRQESGELERMREKDFGRG